MFSSIYKNKLKIKGVHKVHEPMGLKTCIFISFLTCYILQCMVIEENEKSKERGKKINGRKVMKKKKGETLN
jgi:hypothetical protein